MEKVLTHSAPHQRTRGGHAGVTAQINPPVNYTRVYSRQCPGIIWNIPWELPDYAPGYTLGAPRVYPTSPEYPGVYLWELPEYTLGYSLGAARLYLGYSPDYTRV